MSDFFVPYEYGWRSTLRRWLPIARVLRWVVPSAFAVLAVADFLIYAGSVRALSDLSRDMAQKVAENRLPEGLVPRAALADLPMGTRRVRITATPGREMTLDFTVATSEASLIGIVGLVTGKTVTVRSTVIRHPGAIPAVFSR